MLSRAKNDDHKKPDKDIKEAMTSKIKHAIKLKTSPARLAHCTTVAALITILF